MQNNLIQTENLKDPKDSKLEDIKYNPTELRKFQERFINKEPISYCLNKDY